MDNQNSNENDKLIEDILKSKKNVDDIKSQKKLDAENQISDEVISTTDDILSEDSDIDDIVDDEDDNEIHNSKKKKKKKKTYGKLVFGLILSAVIVTVAIFLALAIITVGKDMLGVDKSEDNIVINIPQGATVNEISEILHEKGIIENPLAFKVISKLQHADSYIAGDHLVRPNMAYETLIAELQSDAIQNKVSVTVTFPEGLSLFEYAQLLEENKVCSADEFIKVFNSSEFGYSFENDVVNSPKKFYKMEGYCFPDTYTFFEESEPEIAAKKIYQRYSEMVNANMMGRMKDLNLTLDQTMTFASIVQAEAPNKEQMRKVASVFWNRMNNSEMFPKLESDPTTKYVNEIIKPNIELANESMYIAYDTYQGIGLPPGPICNPGVDAIEAVLYPEETDYYYFCSNLETKEFFYAKTLKEHEKNLVAAGLK